jgi:flavorubredoxin
METRVDEIAARVYRVSTPVPPSRFPGGFTFNQFLIDDDEPALFHTGHRGLFDATSAAVARITPLSRLRYIGLSHVEADECGALNQYLAVAPQAVPLCGALAARVSIGDMADRPPRGLSEGEVLTLGSRSVQWFDTPHVPHSWECGVLMLPGEGVLFCGDLFTQPGDDHPPRSQTDILAPSEQMRARMEYYALAPNSGAILEKLAAQKPHLLACMHGTAWEGDGGMLLRELASRLAASAERIRPLERAI